MLNASLQNPLHKIKTKWPAFILATNRIDKVKGRTNTLTNSTTLKKGFKKEGAPSGKNFALKLFKLLKTLDIIINNHKGKAKVKSRMEHLILLQVTTPPPNLACSFYIH